MLTPDELLQSSKFLQGVTMGLTNGMTQFSNFSEHLQSAHEGLLVTMRTMRGLL